MNKTELLNKADELIKKANELKELANEQDYILVPDNIKITKPVFWFWMWIINWEQELFYNKYYKNWLVRGIDSRDNDRIIKCKLTPCEYEDLEPWDVFYRTNIKGDDFEDLHQYAIKLNDWSCQRRSWNDCENSNFPWEYYWKVEAI